MKNQFCALLDGLVFSQTLIIECIFRKKIKKESDYYVSSKFLELEVLHKSWTENGHLGSILQRENAITVEVIVAKSEVGIYYESLFSKYLPCKHRINSFSITTTVLKNKENKYSLE